MCEEGVLRVVGLRGQKKKKQDSGRNYPSFVAFEVRSAGGLASASLSLPLCLSRSLCRPPRQPSAEQCAAGRGGPAQELNNNFQQSSQEAGSPDCGCSLLLAFLPPQPAPTLLLPFDPPPPLLPPPPPPAAAAGLCLLHGADAFCRQASALKETQAAFLSPESLQWTEPGGTQ